MTKHDGAIPVRSITPCLTFNDHAEEAVNLYVSLFEGSKITNVVRGGKGGPIPEGKALHLSFELQGQPLTAMNGGPSFTLTQAFSLVATVDTQEQLDAIWDRLCSDGGSESRCGWLVDRFGVSWQVVPKALGEMMSDAKSGNPAQLMEALMGMNRLDIAALRAAYRR